MVCVWLGSHDQYMGNFYTFLILTERLEDTLRQIISRQRVVLIVLILVAVVATTGLIVAILSLIQSDDDTHVHNNKNAQPITDTGIGKNNTGKYIK